MIGLIEINLPIFCFYISSSHKCCEGLIASTIINWEVEIGFYGWLCLYGYCLPTAGVEITADCRILNAPLFGPIKLTIALMCKFGNWRHRCCNDINGGLPDGGTDIEIHNVCIFGK